MLTQLNFDQLQTDIGFAEGKAPIDIAGLIARALPYLFAFAGIGLLAYLIFGGFTLMLAAGDPKKVQQGQSMLTNAVIGFVIIFVAYWLVQLLAIILGLPSITSIFTG